MSEEKMNSPIDPFIIEKSENKKDETEVSNNDNKFPFGEDGILKVPGDKLSAKITEKRELGVVNIDTAEKKETDVIYPTTGTVVKTEVFKNKK